MPAPSPLPRYTKADVARHNTEKDCWIIINNKVYDVSKFLDDHPGGKKVVIRVAGQDASKQFKQFHQVDQVLAKYGPSLLVGELAEDGSESNSDALQPASKKPKQKAVALPSLPRSPNQFGEMIPYGDPSWYQGWNSPYFNESHLKFRAALRAFVDRDIMPHCHEWEENKKLPDDLFRRCHQAGWLAGCAGAPWYSQYAGDQLAGGVRPEEFDPFHELIIYDEVARSGSGVLLCNLVFLCHQWSRLQRSWCLLGHFRWTLYRFASAKNKEALQQAVDRLVDPKGMGGEYLFFSVGRTDSRLLPGFSKSDQSTIPFPAATTSSPLPPTS